MPKAPFLLMILDGWGLREEVEGNAIALAKTPTYEQLLLKYPFTSLKASSEAVGLPSGQMGNSEVGHLNLGAGRIVYQEYTRINKALQDGSFFKNSLLLETFQEVKEKGCSLHLVGLLSDGGVHSHILHLFGLLDMAFQYNVPKICIHALMDGRDTAPFVGEQYIMQLEKKLQEIPQGEISTISGRYYAMDRDNRWERVEKAYQAMVLGEGLRAPSALAAIQQAHLRGEGDEFVVPTVVGERLIEEGDMVLFFNFRADRVRQLTRVFSNPSFTPFPSKVPLQLFVVTMTQYDKTFFLPVIFPPLILSSTLSMILSKGGLKQLHTAETEKYAHVTFFFNGGVEDPLPGEERNLIPSPKVATYDLKPEMSAFELTDYVIQELDKYEFIVMNYANPDMVGHTGNLEAAIMAITTIDTCLTRILQKITLLGGEALITADHGNAEQMMEEGGGPHTAHTINPVPLIYYGPKKIRLQGGILADVAPTVLDLLGMEKPQEMTGRSLLKGVK